MVGKPMKSAARAIEYRHSRPFPRLVFREEIAADGPERQAPPQPELQPETASSWSRVHHRLVSLGRDRAAHERDLCRWLLAAQRLAVHARAGYASLREYAERLVGLNARQTEE